MDHLLNDSADEWLCEALDNIARNLNMRPEEDAILCELLDEIEYSIGQNNLSQVAPVVNNGAGAESMDWTSTDESYEEIQTGHIGNGYGFVQNGIETVEPMDWTSTAEPYGVIQSGYNENGHVFTQQNIEAMEPMESMERPYTAEEMAAMDEIIRELNTAQPLNNVQNEYAIQTGAGTSSNDDPHSTIVTTATRSFQKFSLTGTSYSLKIPPEMWIRKLLDDIIHYFKTNSSVAVRSNDRVGLTLKNNIAHENPLYISLRRADQLNADVIFDHIMKVFDSNKEFFLNGSLEINFDHIKIPHGAGRITRTRSNKY